MNLQIIIQKLQGQWLLRCSALLGRRRMGTKSCDGRLRPELRAVNDRKYKLGEMETYPGTLPDIIEALEKKGMRFDEVSLDNGDIRYLDNNVVVFRGNAAKLLHRAFQGAQRGRAGQKIRQCNLSLGSRSNSAASLSLRLRNRINALC